MQEPAAGYTDYHPRWLRRRVSTYWWLERRTYFAFILRELSSIFVAWTVVYLLMIVRAVSLGNAAFGELLVWSGQPLVLSLNLATLLLVTYHAITWFNVSAQAMDLHVGHAKVRGIWIVASNYAAWAAVSAGIAWIVLGD